MEESREDSKNSSELEAERRWNRNDEEYRKSVRSYECVFCKRGFTTAQALGGHMNIHRKHRAPKTNPNCYPFEGYESSFSPFLAIQTLHFGDGNNNNNQVRAVDINHAYNNSTNRSKDFNLSRDHDDDPNVDLLWRGTSLNLGIVTTRHEEDDHDLNKEKIIIGDFKEDHMEVDLELRLGYDP